MNPNRRNLLIAASIVIVVVVGGLLFFLLGSGGVGTGLSFAQISAIMKPSCTIEQHIAVYMYVAPGDTQTRTWTVKNERTGTTTTSVSPVSQPDGGPKAYERITSKAPADTVEGDTLTVTLTVANKNSPAQVQHVSYICNTGQLIGDTTVRTTLTK